MKGAQDAAEGGAKSKGNRREAPFPASPSSIDPGFAKVREMDTRVFQGIVDDAAAICDAAVVSLRVRDEPTVDEPGSFGSDGLASIALGGRQAGSRGRRELIARRLRGLEESGTWPATSGRGVRLTRCPEGVAAALELRGALFPQELWCADVPLWAEGEFLGALRLFVETEPKRPLLRALRGVGHEASLSLSQERARLRALAQLEAVRRIRTQIAAASVRLRQRLTLGDVQRQLGEELRAFGFESALALLDEEGRLDLRHLSHRPRVAARALKQLGLRTLSDLGTAPKGPAQTPILTALLASAEERYKRSVIRREVSNRVAEAEAALGQI